MSYSADTRYIHSETEMWEVLSRYHCDNIKQAAEDFILYGVCKFYGMTGNGLVELVLRKSTHSYKEGK